MKKTFHVRIVDEHDERTIYAVQFVQKAGSRLIRVQNLIGNGPYKALLLGMSVSALHDWLNSDCPDLDKVLYQEIYDTNKKEWRRMMTRDALLQILPE